MHCGTEGQVRVNEGNVELHIVSPLVSFIALSITIKKYVYWMNCVTEE